MPIDPAIALAQIESSIDTAGVGPSGSVRLHLHPNALGLLGVDLALDRDTVAVTVTTATPAVHAIVGEARNELAQALGHAGLDLGGLSVALGAGPQGDGPSRQPADTRALGDVQRTTPETRANVNATPTRQTTHEGQVNVYA